MTTSSTFSPIGRYLLFFYVTSIQRTPVEANLFASSYYIAANISRWIMLWGTNIKGNFFNMYMHFGICSFRSFALTSLLHVLFLIHWGVRDHQASISLCCLLYLTSYNRSLIFEVLFHWVFTTLPSTLELQLVLSCHGEVDFLTRRCLIDSTWAVSLPCAPWGGPPHCWGTNQEDLASLTWKGYFAVNLTMMPPMPLQKGVL